MKSRILVLTLFLTTALFSGIGYAQEPSQVTLESLIQREIEVVNEDGEKEIQLIEVGNAIPGDELIFTVTYTNQGTEPAENVVLVNPVPDHTIYLDGSAGGDTTVITFSVDEGVSYDLPGSLTVTGDDGRQRAARTEDYTHIRWARTGSLPPGLSGNVYFRVRLK